MRKKRYLRVGLLMLLVLLLLPGQGMVKAQTAKTEILWDIWGVPHIFAADNTGLFYAFGWAQAHNDGDLILKLYGQARGRAAEYWGDEFLESDKLVRTLEIPQQAQANYQKLTQEFKNYVDAFAAGFNDYARANPSALDKQRQIILPVLPTDIVAHGIRVLRYQFVAGTAISHAMDWQNAQGHAQLGTDQAVAQTEFTAGSNAWAIGPPHSASGKAMLVVNPHQPWSDLGLWIEAQFVSPDINLYGAALVGNPVISIGFNQYLGWAHTVNTQGGWSLYELKVTPNGGYLFDGSEKSFDTHTETIKVLQPNKTIKEVPITIRQSVHGPVIAQNGDRALSLRVVGENVTDATIEWWEMGRATNLQQFEAALKPLRIPMFTVMYADRDGNIMHLFNAQVPIRAAGDWAFWNNLTPVTPSKVALIPGDTSRYLWTQYHPYEDLPRVLNPASGWLQNANEPPWSTTFPLALDPSKYPPYMAPPPYIWPRPQSSIRLLYENPSIAFEQLPALTQSTFSELTTQVLDALITAARQSDKANAQKAAEILAKWDRHADADSVGAALFAAWAINYVQPTGTAIFAKPWDIHDPLNTPHGLSNPGAAVDALDKVATQLEALRPLGGGMDVPYGKAFRMRVGKYDLPASGSFDVLGTFRTLNFTQDKDLRFKAVQGNSYMVLAEFSQPIHAKVLLTYGNATQPDSPHVGDQLELFANKQFRDAWLTRDVIEQHLEGQNSFDEAAIARSILSGQGQ